MIRLGFDGIVKLFIESHADIDSKDNNGKIPLFLAVQNGKADKTKVEHDAVDNKKNIKI